jgi:hypothetical protein
MEAASQVILAVRRVEQLCADPDLRKKPPKTPFDGCHHGLQPAGKPKSSKRKWDYREHLPLPTYPPTPALPPLLYWERDLETALPSFPDPLGKKATIYLIGLTTIHLTGPKAQWIRQCLIHGWPSFHEMPFTRRHLENAIKPGDPGSEGIDAQIARLTAAGQVMSSPHPLLPGTINFSLGVVTKEVLLQDGSCKTKIRPTANASTPYDHTSITAWTPAAASSFSQNHFESVIAAALLTGQCTASTLDLSNSFEHVRKRRSDIRHNCYFWKDRYFYLNVHVFGQSEAPSNANGLFSLSTLEGARQAEEVTEVKHPAFRNCDDTLLLHPAHDQANARRVFDTHVGVIQKCGLTINDSKTVIAKNVLSWYGYQFDFWLQTVGYSKAKTIALAKLIIKALEPTSLTFKDGETLVGKLEHWCMAAVWSKPLLPAVRSSIYAIKALPPSATVNFSKIAQKDMHRLHNDVSSKTGRAISTFRDHFRTTHHTVVLYSDASGAAAAGVDGVGGFAPGWHTYAAWTVVSPMVDGSPWILSDGIYSTALIEMLGLLMLLLAPDSTNSLHHVSILWRTDSAAAVGAWNSRRSPAPAVNEVLKRCMARLSHLGSHVYAEHIPRAQNTQADLLSHSDSTTFIHKGGPPTFVPSARQLKKELGKLLSTFRPTVTTPPSATPTPTTP